MTLSLMSAVGPLEITGLSRFAERVPRSIMATPDERWHEDLKYQQLVHADPFSDEDIMYRTMLVKWKTLYNVDQVKDFQVFDKQFHEMHFIARELARMFRAKVPVNNLNDVTELDINNLACQVLNKTMNAPEHIIVLPNLLVVASDQFQLCLTRMKDPDTNQRLERGALICPKPDTFQVITYSGRVIIDPPRGSAA